MLSGFRDTKENTGMNCDQANIKQMINTIISYQFNLQCHCFHLSLLWVFSILLLYWSHQCFWKKKDFLLIKFFNLNFRFSIGSANATFVVYFHWWLHEKLQYFCTSSCLWKFDFIYLFFFLFLLIFFFCSLLPWIWATWSLLW